jgi:hypothetical protein
MAMPGTDHRALADAPPNLKAILNADYRGGLSILCGTRHFAGGYVLGLDIDQGPSQWPRWPLGTLLAEHGTAPGKWHVFLRSRDRLDGQMVLRDPTGGIIAELKGYGLSLRSWPTAPAGKPKGYRLAYVASPPEESAPTLTASGISEGLAHYLGTALGCQVRVATTATTPRRSPAKGRAPGWVGLVYEAIIDHLAAHGGRLTRNGAGLMAQCPFHNDHPSRPSLSVHPERGWKCWAGCGSGKLTVLAHRLGINVLEAA